ncbi:MAG: LysR family transcriptional regulator [Burkholderiaceae bacterium]
MSVFEQVVQAKSFSAAATQLGLSKSVVSRQISALEQSLGLKLLIRSTRKLSLTEGGATFYEHCARVVHEAAYAEQRVKQTQSELAGLVRVTCVQAFALRHLMPALGEFQSRHPEIQIKLSCNNRRIDLGEDRFDIGIRVSDNPDPNLVARKLAVNRKLMCAAPAYLARRGTPRAVADLAGHDAVVFPPLAPKGVWTLRHAGRDHTVHFTARLETDDMDATQAALVAGLGLGPLPEYVAADDLRRGRLVPLLREFEVVPEFGIYLVHQSNRTMPMRVRALIDFLVQRFAPTPPWEIGW